RDVSAVPRELLSRIDVCWSVSLGLNYVDPVRGALFHADNLLLSLRAGEPYRIARALAMEAGQSAGSGGRPAARRTPRLLEAADRLARQVDNPQALGLVALCRAAVAYLEHRWKEALALAEQAEAILRDSCTGVARERDAAQGVGLIALFCLGQFGELSRRL